MKTVKVRIKAWLEKEKNILSDIGGQGTLEIITGQESSRYKKKNTDTERYKVMEKYAQMNKYHRGHKI